LNLFLQTDVTYEFAVWGTNPDADPDTLFGYWFNHYSNPFLSGARADNKSGKYLRCDAAQLSAPCFVEDPALTQTWDKRANFHIEIDGVIGTPEPSQFIISGSALLGIALLSGVRRKVQSSRFGHLTDDQAH